MAMMSMGEFRQIGEETRKSLRIVTEFARVPGFLVLSNPKLVSAEVQRLKALILQFPKSEDGKRFIVIDGKPILKDQYQHQLDVGPYTQEKK